MAHGNSTSSEVMKTLCMRCRGVVEAPPDRIGTSVPCPHCGEAALFKDPASLPFFWAVSCISGKQLRDKGGAIGVLFEKEDKAMRWAEETSIMPQYRKDTIRVTTHTNPSSGATIAEYLNGVEQLEKLALDSIILECKIFAEYRAKSYTHPMTLVVIAIIAVIVWVYGCAWLANLIGSASGDAIAFVVVSGAIIAFAVVIGRDVQKRHKMYDGECVKWAREVVYRVMKTNPALRERILNTRRMTRSLPWDDDMKNKFGDEIRRLERAGFE